MYFMIGLVN